MTSKCHLTVVLSLADSEGLVVAPKLKTNSCHEKNIKRNNQKTDI